MGEIRVNHCSGLWTLKSDVLLRTGETLKWHNRHLPILQQNHSGGACVAANLTAKPFWRCLCSAHLTAKPFRWCLCCCQSYGKTILYVPVLLPILQQNHFVVACVAANLTAKPFWRCLCCCQSYSKTILAMFVLLPILQQNYSGDTCVALGVSFPLFEPPGFFSLRTFAEKTNGFQFKTS